MSQGILEYSVYFSILLRVISCLILGRFCLPLQFREANVKNGLFHLRRLLLMFGVILFSTNVISLIFLISAVATPQKPLNVTLQVINALAFLALAVIGYKIYYGQYNDESKAAHKELAKMEKKQADAKKS